MPYSPSTQEFVWDVPAKVLAVTSGDRFLADADLGFGVHAHIEVVVSGLDVKHEPQARKEAQRLLHGADVVLQCLRQEMEGRGWICEVLYGPFFQPRSEQASFRAAMLASGYA